MDLTDMAGDNLPEIWDAPPELTFNDIEKCRKIYVFAHEATDLHQGVMRRYFGIVDEEGVITLRKFNLSDDDCINIGKNLSRKKQKGYKILFDQVPKEYSSFSLCEIPTKYKEKIIKQIEN